MNNMLSYKGYIGSVEYSDADEVFCGKLLGITDLILYHGDSVASIKQDFIDAVDDYLQYCKDEGKKPDKPCKGAFNIKIAPDLHSQLVNYSNLHGKSINATIEEAITNLVNV
ncbi:MAG: type II toxin-antitoxin system HicB family antitoxin [Chitinispirillia bacterium]|nr:type II toxin-antitoxin system HicB family antitoxin [Chitinispirillia bacterium]MCL2241316.1 type II toxin-antitoxin system HicB family antitoxin [Chitinispirillia bacterium]